MIFDGYKNTEKKIFIIQVEERMNDIELLLNGWCMCVQLICSAYHLTDFYIMRYCS